MGTCLGSLLVVFVFIIYNVEYNYLNIQKNIILFKAKMSCVLVAIDLLRLG